MCWKRKPPTPIVNCKKMLLTYAVNNYPGSSNDLNGCVNDQTDLINALSGWSVTAFRDHEVTVRSFNDNVKNYILGMTAGDFLIIHYSGHGTRVRDTDGDEEDGFDEALYLYDGTFTDDQFNQLMLLIPEGAKVMVVLDSCFSGTATRRGGYSKAKYVAPAEQQMWVYNKIEKASGLNHILFSGCRSDQTSADAYINGRYNGAFSFFWLRAMNLNMTYREWIAETVRLISLNGFEQVPRLEGPEDMLNQKILT